MVGDPAQAIVMRCDGGAAIGLGHVSRSLALADALRDAHRCRVTFAMRDLESVGVARVRAQGYDVASIEADAESDYGTSLQRLVMSHDARALVVDVHDRLSLASLAAIRATGVRIVTIDDGSDRRFASDLAFYPPMPQVAEMSWRGFTGERYAGWDWVILGGSFANEAGGAGGDESPAIDILVTMGGSDPARMTEFTVGALGLLEMPFAVRVVVGPAFDRAEELIDAVAHSKHSIQIARAPASLAPLMRASRMAIAAFGVTAYELAACGVPAVHLCLTDDHARSSSVFEQEGIAITTGVLERVRPHHVAGAVSRLMGHAGRRGEIAARARQLVDGRGAKRVAALVAAGL